MDRKQKVHFTYSVPWNLFLITAGVLISTLALKGIARPQELVPGGVFGAALLMVYAGLPLSAGLLYAVLNIPLFVAGWLMVSRRFFLYSSYATLLASAAYELLPGDLGFHNLVFAALACGGVMGFGMGVVLRSLGSNGGLDILAVILNQRYNLGIGKLYFLFNLLLFSLSLAVISPDRVVASALTVFVASVTMEYALALFSNRKLVIVITTREEEVGRAIIDKLKQGMTYLSGRGGYTGREQGVIMTVTNNVALKRLEEIVFSEDPKAIFIVENTFNVLGSGFNRRKLY